MAKIFLIILLVPFYSKAAWVEKGWLEDPNHPPTVTRVPGCSMNSGVCVWPALHVYDYVEDTMVKAKSVPLNPRVPLDPDPNAYIDHVVRSVKNRVATQAEIHCQTQNGRCPDLRTCLKHQLQTDPSQAASEAGTKEPQAKGIQ